MNRNRKSPLEKKISKRFFYSVSRFFCVSVFFLSTNRVIFSIALIRVAEKKIDEKLKGKETLNAYASIVHRIKCRVSVI